MSDALINTDIAGTVDLSAGLFNFSFAPNIPNAQIVAFEAAGQLWSEYLTDDIDVNVYVASTQDLPENVIGGALPGFKTFDYRDFRTALRNDRSSAGDFTAYDSLGGDYRYDDGRSYVRNDYHEFDAVINGNGLVDDIDKVTLTRANAKALGLINPEDAALDAFIAFSDLSNFDNISWDYNFFDDVIGEREVDFLSVAVHELGHVLGFTSTMDNEGWIEQNITADQTFSSTSRRLRNVSTITNPDTVNSLDLFRYTKASAKHGLIDLSYGDDAYFSIDRGASEITSFSTGKDTTLGADGYQASHWGDQTAAGIMVPSMRLAEIVEIKRADLIAMDVIGYDLNDEGTVDYAGLFADADAQIRNNRYSGDDDDDDDDDDEWDDDDDEGGYFMTLNTNTTSTAIIDSTKSDLKVSKSRKALGQTMAKGLGKSELELDDLLDEDDQGENYGQSKKSDREAEVNAMLANSGEMYNWGFGRGDGYQWGFGRGDGYQWGFGRGDGYQWGFGRGDGYHWGFGRGDSYHMGAFFSQFGSYFSTLDIPGSEGVSSSPNPTDLTNPDGEVIAAIDWDDDAIGPMAESTPAPTINWDDLEAQVSNGNTEITFTELTPDETSPATGQVLIEDLITLAA